MIDKEKILKCRSCLELFPEDKTEANKVYISLMKQFHPDVNKDTDSVIISALINSLYKRIKEKPKIRYESLYPENITFPYIRSYKREDQGNQKNGMYYNTDSVIYVIDSNAWRNNIYKTDNGYRLKAEKDVNSDVLENSKSFLPNIVSCIKLTDGSILIKEKLEEGEIPLDELLDFYSAETDSKHCAWIISRIIGLCCFAHLGGNVLNCITTSNFMVNPKMHTIRLTGGWWFMKKAGEKMHGIQNEVYENMSISSKTDKCSRFITDLECIKAICKKIFPSDSPKAMLEYADSLCCNDIFEEFEEWEQVINKSFGGRFFTEMKLCAADIYI